MNLCAELVQITPVKAETASGPKNVGQVSCRAFAANDPLWHQGCEQVEEKVASGDTLYQYAPNPISWIDPLGLTAQKEDPQRQVKAISNPSLQKADFYVGPSGPSATMPSTAYRYERLLNDDGTDYTWGQSMLNNNAGKPTYFGFEEYATAEEALDAFQIKGPSVGPDANGAGSWSDARIRGKFDTLQLYDKGVPGVRVPYMYGDTDKSQLEPIAEAYPQYGKGGAVQLHADRRDVKYDSVEIIPEKK